MCSARHPASQLRASLTDPLALLPPIAHQQKGFLKIAQSQVCTSNPLDQRGRSNPCSHVAGALEARKQLLPAPSTRSASKKKKFSRVSSLRTPVSVRDIRVQIPARFRSVRRGCELPTSARVQGVRSRLSDARQAIFTCFPRSSTLPLLGSCTCQLCSRHQ